MSDVPLFVYKNNSAGDDAGNASWGLWADFFRRGTPQPWGGSWMTRSALSLKILREEIGKGDRILAWQSDHRVAVGTALVHRIDEDEDGGRELILKREEHFSRPVPLLDLRAADAQLANVKAFRPGGGTLFRTTSEEARVLLDACSRWQTG